MYFKAILIVIVACTSCYCKKSQAENGFQMLPEKLVKLYEKSDSWIGNNITLYGIGSYIKESNNRTTKCFLKHEANYTLIIRRFTVEMNDVARGVRKYFDAILGKFQQNYAKHGQKIQSAWTKIIIAMQEYPYQLKAYLKEKDFKSAYEYMEKTKKEVELNDVTSEFLVRDIKIQMPEQFSKIKEQINEMRQNIKKETRVISKKIQKCIQRDEKEKD